MCVAKLTQLMLYYKVSLKLISLTKEPKHLERKTCFLFQSKAEAHVSVNSFHNAKLNIKGIERG